MGLPESGSAVCDCLFAPRVSGFLHTLFGDSGKSSIRAGYGIVFRSFRRRSLVNTFDRNGSWGLTTTFSNPAGVNPRWTIRLRYRDFLGWNLPAGEMRAFTQRLSLHPSFRNPEYLWPSHCLGD